MPPVLRHGLFYATIYVGSGISLPYIPLWMKSVGLTAPQIGVILATPMILRVAAGPAVALWADRFQLRRTPMSVLAMIAAAAYGLMLAVHGFWLWCGLWFIASTAISAVSPLGDVLTLRRAKVLGFPYAVARGIGSSAYICSNIAGGILLRTLSPVLALILPVTAALTTAAAARTLLPPEPVHLPGDAEHGQDGWTVLKGLLRDSRLMLLVAAASMIQGAHALFYGFSTIAWISHGIPSNIVGLLWGVSVGAEVAFFWFGEGFRRRMGAEQLILLAAVASVVRWTALALSPPLWLLFPLQCLHAFTFAAAFTGALDLVERFSPRAHASTAQTLVASVSFGLGTGLATVASGWLFARFEVHGYFAMAAMGVVGCIAALALKREAASNPKAPAAAARSSNR